MFIRNGLSVCLSGHFGTELLLQTYMVIFVWEWDHTRCSRHVGTELFFKLWRRCSAWQSVRCYLRRPPGTVLLYYICGDFHTHKEQHLFWRLSRKFRSRMRSYALFTACWRQAFLGWPLHNSLRKHRIACIVDDMVLSNFWNRISGVFDGDLVFPTCVYLYRGIVCHPWCDAWRRHL